MATTKRTSTRSSAARTTPARAARNIDGVERVGASLEQAQKALSTMRGDVESGARSLVDDVERMVTDARRDLTKLTKALRSDVEDLQKAVTKPAPPKRRAASGSRRPKATGAAKR
jgi:hypothetical protein